MNATEIAKLEHDFALKKAEISKLRSANKDDADMGLLTAGFGGYVYSDARAMVNQFTKPGSDKGLDRNMAIALYFANDQWGKDLQTRNILKGMAGALGNDMKRRGGILGMFTAKTGLSLVK